MASSVSDPVHAPSSGRPDTQRRARRQGRPPGVDGEDTIKRIIEVAERQFAEVGYATATNKTISHECGLSTAAIYHHFGTKLALFEAVAETVFTSMIDAYRTALNPIDGFRAQFETMLDVSISLNSDRPSLAGFVMGAPVEARRHPELRDVVDRHFLRIEQLVTQLVEPAKATGELSESVRTADIVDMLLSIMHGIAHLAYRDASTEKHAQVVGAFKELLDGRLLAQP